LRFFFLIVRLLFGLEWECVFELDTFVFDAWLYGVPVFLGIFVLSVRHPR